MEQVAAFKASDGSLFEAQGQCEAHEISLLWRDRIETFNQSGLNPYPRGAQSFMSAKVIVAWERFKVRESVV